MTRSGSGDIRAEGLARPVVLVVDDQPSKFQRLVQAAARFDNGRLAQQFQFEYIGCLQELKDWYRCNKGRFVALIIQDVDFSCLKDEDKLAGFPVGLRPVSITIDVKILQGVIIYSHLRQEGLDRVVPVLFTARPEELPHLREIADFIMFPGYGTCSFIDENTDSPSGLEAVLAAIDVHALRPLDPGQRQHWRDHHQMVVGRSRKMVRLAHEIERVGPTDGIVLLLGGAGVGKELVANALHRTSYRYDNRSRQAPLTINMATLDRNLVWDDLFGHESGAYTGATGARAGIFEAAHGSTVFLDEIGDIDGELQTKLLRVIEYHKVKRLGSSVERDVDIRIIAATNKTIEELQLQFRRDFYSRLVQQCIPVPSLKERWQEEAPATVEADIEELFNFVVENMNQNPRHRRQLTPDPTAVRFLGQLVIQYIQGGNSLFDGNIRTLRTIIERAYERAQYDGAAVIGMGQVATTLSMFQALTVSNRPKPGAASIEKAVGTLDLREVERQAIIEALAKTGNNQTAAAKMLGIDRITLRNKMKRYGLLQ